MRKKQGLPLLWRLKCFTSSCRYISPFFTPAKVNRCFEINQQIVYTMRSLCHGYAGIEKLNILMNIPKPMTVKYYSKTVLKIIDAVNVVDVVYHRYWDKETVCRALSKTSGNPVGKQKKKEKWLGLQV